ncbi:PilW family protein [uncultured Comamonas sp.]|uniref:PilW family protein n=1 Tax=uncultured Comamonas sp. TaxID=114710 RepID=UPI0025FC8B15|nr:PilW family protein [uncultured Comamonas sp.]
MKVSLISARAARSRPQRGVTLIELLVGIVIGLLTVAVAMGALMVSRGVTGSVSDSSMLQQQAAFAFRVIGQQTRQAGSLKLNLASQKAEGVDIDMSDPVAFETQVDPSAPVINPIRGLDNPGNGEYKLTLSYLNYKEPVYTSTNTASILRDCLGQNPDDNLIQSRFILDSTVSELRCVGASGQPQPIIQNVANFQVRYLLQTSAASGNPQISYVDAATVASAWPQVVGVEICLVLYGNEAIDMPDNTSYLDCDNSTSVTMNTLASPRTRRAHMVFRNVYQLRSQGLTTVG